MSFLSLPLEIRDEIYKFCLVRNPIMVWDYAKYGARRKGLDKERSRLSHESLSNVEIQLLGVNRSIFAGASRVFYGSNKFCFRGCKTWDPLYIFLEMIGEQNRSHLRDLEFEIAKPAPVKVCADGTRYYGKLWYSRKLLPYDEELHRYCEPYSSGEVDHIDPTIRSVFRILGKEGPNLMLNLPVMHNMLPGVQLYQDLYDANGNLWRLTLPRLLESLSKKYTGGRVKLIWKLVVFKHLFEKSREAVLEANWVIVSVEEWVATGLRPSVLVHLRRSQNDEI